MTPHELDAALAELCRTNNRDALHAKGLELIARALGAGAPAYIPAIDRWCRRVRQLGKPVVPVAWQGAARDEGRAL